jgi:uncharacterized protein YdaU (DUF1376 family)
MTKPHSMPFLVDKYLADTGHLSLEEHGAYCVLLFNMWKGGGSLADNDANLSRLLGVTPKAWKRLRERLAPLMECYGGLITQKRLQKQWNYAVEYSKQAKEKASFAAKRRWEKAHGLNHINSMLQALPQAMPAKQCPSDAILKERYIPIPLSNSYAPEEGSEQEPSDKVSRLLNTNLMRKTG